MQQIICYTRVSTKEQGASGNGLEAQKAALEKFAAANQYEIIDVVEEVASGKLDCEGRPKLKAAIKRCLKEKAILVVSKLDRLSRKASLIFNLMNTKLNFIVAEFGANVAPFMIHIHAVVAEDERKKIGERTKAALEVLRNKGVFLGNPREVDGLDSEGNISLGRSSARKLASGVIKADADQFAQRMKPTISRMMKAGMSYAAIARELNDTNVKTARDGRWATTTVINLVQRWA